MLKKKKNYVYNFILFIVCLFLEAKHVLWCPMQFCGVKNNINDVYVMGISNYEF